MGSKQRASKRRPAPTRTTGQRKAARKKTGGNESDSSGTPTRPKRSQPRAQASKTSLPAIDEDGEEESYAYVNAEAGELSPLDLYTLADDGKRASPIGPIEGSDASIEEEGRPVINLTFDVPYKNASRELAVESDISFSDLLVQIAAKMETSIVCLSHIGYILPWMVPKTGKPVAKLLEDGASFQKLIEHVWNHIDEQKAKNRGKGKVKPFSIQIVDTSEPGTEKGPGKRKTQVQSAPSNALSDLPGQEQHELLKLLTDKHQCEKHNTLCYVQMNGVHYQYTMEDLCIWASLLARRLATVDTPPDKLNLTDKCFRQVKVRNRETSQPPPFDTLGSMPNPSHTVAGSSSDPPQWAQMMMMMLGGAFANNVNGSNSHRLPRSENIIPFTPNPGSSPPQSKRTASDRNITYPDLREWLRSIEEHPVRNKYGEDLSQYADILVETHKLYTIEDIVPLTRSELADVGGMEFGTASRILRFAVEDASAMEKNKKARFQEYTNTFLY